MKKYLLGLVATLLVIILAFQTPGICVNASAENTNYVYVNGIRFAVYIDSDNNIVVKSADDKTNATLKLKMGKGATATIENKNHQREIFTYNIQNLSSKDASVSILKNGTIIEKISDISDLQPDTYTGQAAAIGILFGGAVLAEALLWALIIAGIVIVVAGVTYIAVSSAKTEIEKKQSQYFSAYLVTGPTGNVFINPIGIGYSTAVSRLSSGKNVYTWTSAQAKMICIGTGLGYIGPENHRNGNIIGAYYNHYHPGNRIGHSFYGLPC